MNKETINTWMEIVDISNEMDRELDEIKEEINGLKNKLIASAKSKYNVTLNINKKLWELEREYLELRR